MVEALPAAVLATAIIGCSTATSPPPTGLEVIIRGDGLSAPADFDDIHVEVSQLESNGTAWNPIWVVDYPVTAPPSPNMPYPSMGVSLPATLAVVSGASADEDVLVAVTALAGGAQGVPVVLRQVQVRAPTDRMAALQVVLAKNCEGFVTQGGVGRKWVPTCPVNGQSCLPQLGACGDSNIGNGSTLPTYVPGGSLDEGWDAALPPAQDGDGAAPTSD